MNTNNSISKTKKHNDSVEKTRKVREELSKSAAKCLKKEKVEVTLKFD